MADFSSSFVKQDGPAMGLGNLPSPELDLKEELLSGRVKVLTKSERLAFHDSATSKRTPCFYNWFSKMVGGCENWVFAQRAEDCFIVSYKSI